MKRSRKSPQQGPVDALLVAVAPGDEALVTELASLVIERMAPDELAVVPLVARDYFADPAETLGSRGRDQALGFGLDLALMTPYALAVATPVVQYLGSLATSIAQDVVKDEAKPLVHDVVRQMFRRRPQQPTAVMLTPEQVDRVHERSYRIALALDMPDDQARLLADALAGTVNRSE